MAAEQSPDLLAKKVFQITMIGSALFIGVVFAFIL